ncbi:MAG TPA: glycosyl hydrolase family 28 protein [Capsulimonadaceae bacterium]|jgi:hypothetical protein
MKAIGATIVALTITLYANNPSGALADNSVRIAPAAEGEPVSSRYQVTVDNQNVPVYTARVKCISKVGTPNSREETLNGEAAFASFDCRARSATVTVTYYQPVESARILPLASRVTAKITGTTVTFKMPIRAQYTLEINGEWNNSLHLFANPVEADAPDPKDPNVIYFGSGVHEIDSVHVHSGQTVYIADGAVIHGDSDAPGAGAPVFVLDGENITLRGRGIIDGARYKKASPAAHVVEVANGSRNVRIEGVTLRNSRYWTMPVRQARDVKIDNVKIFGYNGNSDGIDIDGGQNCVVENCFIRTFDDLVVVKTRSGNGPTANNIVVRRCVLWNEIAHALSLGAELNADIDNVLFTDCDIIHDKGREWLLRVYNSGCANVKRVVFDNIRIEEARRPASLWIGTSRWVGPGERGRVSDIQFRKITMVSPELATPFASLVGYDSAHMVSGVTFEDVTVGGQSIAATDIEQNSFVGNITVRAGRAAKRGMETARSGQ